MFAVRVMLLLRIKPIVQMNLAETLIRFNREDIKVQFIACELDKLTTLEEMHELYGWFKTKNKSFDVFQRAGHLDAIRSDVNLYSKLTSGWGEVC